MNRLKSLKKSVTEFWAGNEWMEKISTTRKRERDCLSADIHRQEPTHIDWLHSLFSPDAWTSKSAVSQVEKAPILLWGEGGERVRKKAKNILFWALLRMIKHFQSSNRMLSMQTLTHKKSNKNTLNFCSEQRPIRFRHFVLSDCDPIKNVH